MDDRLSSKVTGGSVNEYELGSTHQSFWLCILEHRSGYKPYGTRVIVSCNVGCEFYVVCVSDHSGVEITPTPVAFNVERGRF